MLEKIKYAEKLNEVVDKENVLFEPKEKLKDGVPIRIYGTYEYLYVDPVKCSSEVENILKQENMCISEAFQKALEEDLSHLRSGGKSKRQVSKTKGYQSMKNLGIVFEASLQPFEL
ncbi:autophagy-related protein 16 isoform X1 [Iris pallida]|uniref:Autophagy-related protein 16 isoform X1 n=1 Tax=Iris pallida TaxID=29817 RepID=A0AAX6DGT5_IRIPA|nr:autophagy-related protein 16 isoform X1 [Iris pallida]